MAGMTNVANASVTIIPVMEGAQKSITEQLTNEATSAGTAAGKSMGTSLSNSASTSVNFTKVGTSMTKGVTVPLVAVGTASVAAATKFDTFFSKLSTIADTSEVSIGDLKKGIVDLSNETGMSASAVAEAAYSAISAGQSTGNALKFVATSSKLAKGGFTDVSTATDVLTTALNAYGLEAKDADHVSDVLIATQNRGKTTVAELGSSMGKVIPTASAASVSIEDLASQYVALTKNGIGTAESTTYINSMLNELTKSGSSANVAFEQATGQTFPEYIRAGHTTAEAMQELAKYEEEAGLKVTDAFGSAEAGKAANVLVNHTDDATEAFKEMTTQSGQAKAAFETMDQTSAAKMEKMKTSLENIAITLGDTLLPAIEPVVTGITGGIKTMTETFSALPGPVKTGIMALLGTTAVAGPILSAVGKVGTGISTLKTLFGSMSGVMSTATSAIQSASSSMGTAVSGGGFAALKNFLGQDMSSACSTFSGTLGTIGAAIGTFTATYSLTTWVLEQTGAMESLQKWATSTSLNLFDFAGGNSGGWDDRYELSCQKVEQASQGLYTLTSADLQELETVQEHYSTQSTKWFNINKQESEAKANALSSYTTLATTLMGQEGTAATNLATKHSTAATTIKTAMTTESTATTTAKTSMTADQNSIATNAVAKAAEISKSASTVSTDMGTMAKTSSGHLGSLKTSVTTNMSASATTVVSKAAAMSSAIASNLSSASSSASGKFSSISSSASSNMSSAQGAVSSAAQSMKSSFSTQDWGSVGSNAMEGIKGGISGALSGLVQAAANAAQQMLSAAKSALGIASPSKVFAEEVGAFIPPGIAEGIKAETSVAVDEAQTSVNTMVGDITVPSPAQYASMGASILSSMGQLFSGDQMGTPAAAGVGDIIIPVYIGKEHIQDIVVNAQQIHNYRSGGR